MSQIVTIQTNAVGTTSSGVITLTIRRTVAGTVGVAAFVIRVVEADTRNASAIDIAEAGVTINALVLCRAGTGQAGLVAWNAVVVFVIGLSALGVARRPANVAVEGIFAVA